MPTIEELRDANQILINPEGTVDGIKADSHRDMNDLMIDKMAEMEQVIEPMKFIVGDERFPDAPQDGTSNMNLPVRFSAVNVEIYSSDITSPLFYGIDYERSPTPLSLTINLIDLTFSNGGRWEIKAVK